MYSGEMEVQVKRKILAVLHDEINKILNASRELSNLTSVIINQKSTTDITLILKKITDIEEEVEDIRRKITREVAEVGSLMVYREDVLRTAYTIDDIAGYISGIAFRLSNIEIIVLKNHELDTDIQVLVEKVVDAIFKLNEMARALTINPQNIIELSQEVQELERDIDSRYRNTIIKAVKNGSNNTSELILLKDVIEGIEGMADKCQEASDSFTILALSL
ncbi:MAG: DUF47 domain-containing protein [Nitrososphaeraceae archaeon]